MKAFKITFILVALFLAGFGYGMAYIKYKAVKAGAAEYYLDADHNRQFRWKGQQQ
jgi:hypothetical protein